VRFPGKLKDDKDTVLQPDICVVCDPAKLDDKGCTGAPDIVVEILSPGNNAKEMRNKYEVYEQSGVKEYWIVSPQNETFLIYTLHDGKSQSSRPLASGDFATSPVLPGFSLDLEALFKAINN
jgi:Uma2 family endonuclease